MGGALEGWVVVVTRAEEEGGPLGRALADQGATVILLPTVEIGPPADTAALDTALGRLGDYDWIVFTSGRAVEALEARGVTLAIGTLVAVVGPSTAARAETAGMEVELVGDGSGAEALARTLLSRGIGEGSRVFFPTSDRGRTELEEILVEAGASVDRVTAYETRLRSPDLDAALGLEEADVVTFTSPSAVEGWRTLVEKEGVVLPDRVRYVVIGETTEAAAADLGIAAVRAAETSFQGVVETICALASGSRGRAPAATSEEETS